MADTYIYSFFPFDVALSIKLCIFLPFQGQLYHKRIICQLSLVDVCQGVQAYTQCATKKFKVKKSSSKI